MPRRNRASIGGIDPERPDQREAANSDKAGNDTGPRVNQIAPETGDLFGGEPYQPARAHPMTPAIQPDRGLPS